MVESIRKLVASPKCGRVSSTAVYNKFTPHPNLRPGPLSPTPACYPLLSIAPCCLLYISEDRVIREEGGGGVEEEGGVTWVEINGM